MFLKIMSFHWCHFLCLIFMVSLGVEQANGNRMFAQSYFPTQSIQVDPTGHGNFLTIQSAIDSIPSNNKFWTAINVKAGTYR